MERIGYWNGEIGDFDKMMIPMGDRAIYFGDAVYDAVLVLEGKTFALEQHLDRLYNSCAMMNIEFTMPREEIKKEIFRLIEKCEKSTAMLYLQVSRGDAPRKHEYPTDIKPNLLMYIAGATVPPRDKRATLTSMEDMRFRYCNIKTTNLLPNVFASQKAKEAGATEALMHRGDRVTEAAHSSILIIKNGAVIMPPLDELILPGITRAITKQVCEELDIPVEFRAFTVDELMNADEVILCSTTKCVIFVYEVDGKPVGGKDAALREKIQSRFAEKVWEETGVRV